MSIPNIALFSGLLLIIFSIPSPAFTSVNIENPDSNNDVLKSATLYLNVTRRIRRNLLQLDDGKKQDLQQAVDMFNSLNEISNRDGLVCKLCIVLDQELAEAYKLQDSTKIIIFFRKLIDRVSWIFRNIDWNGDGIPDNIGFEIISLVKGWTPYPMQYSSSYGRPEPAMELLGLFAQHDFHHCCLGVGFTNRPFEHNQVGVSFISSDSLLGGICDFRPPSPPLRSANVALISAMGLKGVQLSERDLGNVLLHELGHTFGVLKHDMDLEPKCSGYESSNPIPVDYISDAKEPPQGRFIMWGQDIQGAKASKQNNLNFSPCSKAAVAKVLYSGRGKCLTVDQNENPFCGNGIVEFPEECDCGNELKCSEDSCCGPRGSSNPCQLFKGIDTTKCTVLNQQPRSGTAVPNSKSNQSRSGAGANFQAFTSFMDKLLISIIQLVIIMQ